MRAANAHVKLLKLVATGAAAAMLALALAPQAASPGAFKVVHSFCSQPQCSDGQVPTAPLTMDAEGSLYGTTTKAGGEFSGTAYRLTPNAKGHYKFNVMARFPNLSGRPNNGALVMDTSRNFYGMYSTGGFYMLKPGFGRHDKRWLLVDLSVSCSQQPDCGTNPVGSLTYAGASSGAPYDGKSPLYGAMDTGGLNRTGTVFSLTPNGNGQWIQSVLFNFCSQAPCTEGEIPNGGVILDTAGNLYGTAGAGGSGGAGVVYRLSPQGALWSETVLYNFCSVAGCTDGEYPSGDLRFDSAGDLLGTAQYGGQNCSKTCGVLYRLTPSGDTWQQTVIHAFCARRDCSDGATPEGAPTLASDGTLFGTAQNGGGNDIDRLGLGGGVLYRLSADSYKVVHSFCSLANCTDGEYPNGTLTLNASGKLLGTTQLGGISDGGELFMRHP